MIKKALVITLTVVLGACTGSDDAGRDSNSSTEKKPSEYQTQIANSAQSDASGNNATSAEDSVAEQVVAEEQVTSEESEVNIEDGEFADAEAQPQTKITIQSETKDGVEWQAPEEVAYDTAEMVIITPEGERITRKFSAGQPIALNESLPDGLYKWESTVTPEIDPYVKEEMRSVRESGDLQAQEEMMKKFRAEGAFPSKQELKDNRQSGAFVVRDGIATPTTTESSGPDERG